MSRRINLINKTIIAVLILAAITATASACVGDVSPIYANCEGKDDTSELHYYLGNFTVTAYCGCRKCNGIWTGSPTASGEPLTENVTIAVDPAVIPLGSRVYIDGIGFRTAQDTGGAIKGKRIDVYFPSHSEALMFGRKNMTVWLVI